MNIPIKNEREIEKMRVACRCASNVLDRVTGLVRPGITTRDVDQAAADLMAEEQCKSAFLGYRERKSKDLLAVDVHLTRS